MAGEKKYKHNKPGKRQRSPGRRSRHDNVDRRHGSSEHHESNDDDPEYSDVQDWNVTGQDYIAQGQYWQQTQGHMSAGTDPRYDASGYSSYYLNGPQGYTAQPSTQTYTTEYHGAVGGSNYGTTTQHPSTTQAFADPQWPNQHGNQVHQGSRASTWGSNGTDDSTQVYQGSGLEDDDYDDHVDHNAHSQDEQQQHRDQRVEFFLQQRTGVVMANPEFNQGDGDEEQQEPPRQDRHSRRERRERRDHHDHDHRRW